MDQEEWMHRYVAYLSHLGWQPYELERMAFNAWESWAEEDPEEIASVEDARSFIAQHYAPVIAENERLRQLLPFTRHNINCPVSYGTTADQCLCGLTKARATLAKLEKARG